MMKGRVLLWYVIHHRLFARLRRQHRGLILCLTELRLLLLLCDVAWRAAACAQTIRATVALEVVLRPHVASSEHRHDERNADASETAETHALQSDVSAEPVAEERR
jgi:hypothetical protein